MKGQNNNDEFPKTGFGTKNGDIGSIFGYSIIAWVFKKSQIKVKNKKLCHINFEYKLTIW